MARSKLRIRRSFWFVIFILGVSMTIFAVSLVVSDYLSFPVQTAVSLEFHNKVRREGNYLRFT